MAIHIRSELEKEIERIKQRLEKDMGMNVSKINAVRRCVDEYKKRHGM